MNTWHVSIFYFLERKTWCKLKTGHKNIHHTYTRSTPSLKWKRGNPIPRSPTILVAISKDKGNGTETVIKKLMYLRIHRNIKTSINILWNWKPTLNEHCVKKECYKYISHNGRFIWASVLQIHLKLVFLMQIVRRRIEKGSKKADSYYYCIIIIGDGTHAQYSVPTQKVLVPPRDHRCFLLQHRKWKSLETFSSSIPMQWKRHF